MDTKRLERIINFCKTIEDNSGDAWQNNIMAEVLSEYSNEEIDIQRVKEMVASEKEIK